jgi:hypothetical protein
MANLPDCGITCPATVALVNLFQIAYADQEQRR